VDGDVLGHALFDDISNGILGFYEILVRVLLRALGRRSQGGQQAINRNKMYSVEIDWRESVLRLID
jgi:hypothetical protein